MSNLLDLLLMEVVNYSTTTPKLETTSTGLSVTGAALVDSPSASTGGVEISRYGVYIRSDDSYSKVVLLFTTEVIQPLMKLFFLILTEIYRVL